jgi:hypothetical protein
MRIPPQHAEKFYCRITALFVGCGELEKFQAQWELQSYDPMGDLYHIKSG